MNRTVSLAIGAVLIIGIGGFVYFQTQGTAGAPTAGGSVESGMTATGVAAHAGSESCWTIIDGSVYDLTAWIPEHPGGPQAILQLCGKDGSEKFNGKHGGKEPMTTILAGFKIGTVQ